MRGTRDLVRGALDVRVRRQDGLRSGWGHHLGGYASTFIPRHHDTRKLRVGAVRCVDAVPERCRGPGPVASRARSLSRASAVCNDEGAPDPRERHRDPESYGELEVVSVSAIGRVDPGKTW